MKKPTKINQNPYKDFMREDLWLLFIDGNRLHEGPLAFQGEPGYVEGMTIAHEYTIENLDKPITLSFIEKVHDLSISKIPHLREEAKGYRDVGVNFGLVIDPLNPGANVSPAGLHEMIPELLEIIHTPELWSRNRYPMNGISLETAHLPQTYIVYPTEAEIEPGIEFYRANKIMPKDALHITTADLIRMLDGTTPINGTIKLIAAGTTKSNIKKLNQQDIDQYNADILNAKGDSAKVVAAIVKFVRHCIRSHYFKDGNCRTFAVLMMNHLLQQNKLCPAILMTPNHFAGFSMNELCGEVNAGMELFRRSTINNAKHVIKSLTIDIVKNHPNQLKILIADSLSPHPLIQLAQLNELYTQVKNGSLAPKMKWMLAKSVQSEQVCALLKNSLQEMYIEKVASINETIAHPPVGNATPIVHSRQILDTIQQRHLIYQDLPADKQYSSDTKASLTLK